MTTFANRRPRRQIRLTHRQLKLAVIVTLGVNLLVLVGQVL